VSKRTVVWVGLDASRSEIAHAIVEGSELRARGTQIGVEPSPYELRYDLSPDRLLVELVGGPHREVELGEADFFDLASSPLFNSLPVLRDGLHIGGRPRDYVMAWVDVPSLEVDRSEQRYEPIAPGIVRFRSGSFTADLEFSADGFVSRYPGLAKRVT
jgi:hypothetical protein